MPREEARDGAPDEDASTTEDAKGLEAALEKAEDTPREEALEVTAPGEEANAEDSREETNEAEGDGIPAVEEAALESTTDEANGEDAPRAALLAPGLDAKALLAPEDTPALEAVIDEARRPEDTPEDAPGDDTRLEAPREDLASPEDAPEDAPEDRALEKAGLDGTPGEEAPEERAALDGATPDDTPLDKPPEEAGEDTPGIAPLEPGDDATPEDSPEDTPALDAAAGRPEDNPEDAADDRADDGSPDETSTEDATGAADPGRLLDEDLEEDRDEDLEEGEVAPPPPVGAEIASPMPHQAFVLPTVTAGLNVPVAETVWSTKAPAMFVAESCEHRIAKEPDCVKLPVPPPPSEKPPTTTSLAFVVVKPEAPVVQAVPLVVWSWELPPSGEAEAGAPEYSAIMRMVAAVDGANWTVTLPPGRL